MQWFAPEIEGELELAELPDDFAARIRQRVEEGLLVKGNRHRANYGIRSSSRDEIAFGAEDFWTAINVGLNEVVVRRAGPRTLSYRVALRQWNRFVVGLGAAIGVVILSVVFLPPGATGPLARHPAAAALFWVNLLFWCGLWPWILTALHKRSAARCLERILRQELDEGHSAGGEPFCDHCGYTLIGLADSSKCPECGRPLVEVLRRRGDPAMLGGRRYRSATTVFGLPLVHVAIGPRGKETRGHAKGIIAIGDVATGFLALGGMARGIIALGGLAIGLVGIGGLGVGLVAAAGGGAVGGLAVGGGAVGLVAQGGGAVGVLADGGGACGYLARGGQASGKYTIDRRGASPGARQMANRWAWLIGPRIPSGRLATWTAAAALAVALLTAVVVMLGYVAGWGADRTPAEAPQHQRRPGG